MLSRSSAVSVLLLNLIIFPHALHSQDSAPSTLTGDWGGARSSLSEKGVDVELVYKGDYATVMSGGNERKSYYLQNGDLKLSLDFQKMLNLTGFSSFFYVLWNNEGHLSEAVGDAQATSNIEAPVTTTKLYEAWIQQNAFDDKVSLLLGLHDLNSEFYVTETSGIFLNSSFGIGKDFSQTGINGPSIFPTTSPAARLVMKPSENLYMQTAAFNACAGNPHHARGTHIRLSKNDGLLLITEAGIANSDEKAGRKYKYAFGYWSYTKTFDHLNETLPDGSPKQAVNRGYYFLADQALTEGISMFLRYGYATPEANEFSTGESVGIAMTGLIPSRDDDVLALGISHVDLGREAKKSLKAGGVDPEDAETTLEVTYRIELGRGIAIQPDYQLVLNPSASKEIDNAQVGIVRLEVAL